ncbi:hypothetical protein H5410_039992 [Solanum commersonii]|uniref:DUF4371 domain-containing protein n=1 Tax=Solanum commersonii TaxID=4109 RepID=A0A9J5XR84_SOLCO|nr:hypothetical protein H5410_039992 [Solanum commersonii]
MDKFLIKLPKPKDGQPSSSSNQPFVSSQVAPEVQRHTNSFPLSNMDNMLDFKSLEADPKDRMPISSYGPNIEILNELESRGNAEIHLQEMVLDLKNQRQSIQSSFDKQSEKARSDYRMRLNASIDVARFLLTSGFPFRGHDESEGSEYKGAFLELLKWYGDRSFDVGRVILETTKAIIEDLGGDYFGILVDESKDVSHKEQMALILRYVNKSGMVIGDSWDMMELVICKGNKWSQVFDFTRSSSAYSIHCFAHQLQLALIHFDNIEDKLEELLKFGEVHTRARFESERGLQRRDMKRDCPYHLDRFVAENLLSKIHEFEFVFMLHLMFKVLLLTNELNKVLQKKDQDIVNAMGLLDLSKRLQMMREDEWDSMMDDVSLFCGKHGISIPKMNEDYSNGKSKRKRSNISYLHHFRVEVFYAVIDLALQELNNRFDVVTSDLLLGMASLSPVDSFANFHKDRIMKLAEYYQQVSQLEGNQGSCKSDDRDKTRSNLVTCVSTCEANFDYSICYMRGKSILINEVHKNDLRNRMDEDLLNGCLVCYIERSIFKNVSNDAIIDHFQNMKTRRGQL